jgi:uncharacterized spore protein YtfJ
MDGARTEAEAIAGKLPTLLAGLAERMGASAGAKAVFAEPVSEGGRTVIPVAQAIIGTGGGGGGGGGGAEDAGAGSGLGAGGGAMTRPIGYIELTAGGAAFVPLQRPWADAKLVLVYTLLVLVVGRLAVKLLRG